ncbi:Translation protein SH3-like domain [Lasallia pustulata]|uniref:Translation protein SH3-like domain n=1 Tax=Lasallia pustulata TaxID=136370 RepID=A0A1W5DBJ7_9LECA|nr:Translation protein SH3-like domain [Lasallia pustulata]
MQKVLRRTALAKRQAARRAANRAGADNTEQRRIRQNNNGITGATIQADIQAERLARREDWIMGPLAPRRDVGENKDLYGTVSTRRLQGVDVAEDKRKDWCLKVNDRVVIAVEGHRDRGKIGQIREIREKAQEAFVAGLNRVDIKVPEYMLMTETDKRPIRTLEAPIPLSALRLVHPLPHPDTGELRDVVIKELKRFKRFRDRDSEVGRCIAGVKPYIVIPFPEKEPEEHEDHDIDTLRIEVEEKTFVPTLLRPPMPKTVIDELRNKYSKFRDRHDEDFIARKVKEDKQAAANKRRTELMRTPLKETLRRERMAKKALGKPDLSEDMLARIGEVMAARRAQGQIEQAVPI